MQVWVMVTFCGVVTEKGPEGDFGMLATFDFLFWVLCLSLYLLRKNLLSSISMVLHTLLYVEYQERNLTLKTVF